MDEEINEWFGVRGSTGEINSLPQAKPGDIEWPPQMIQLNATILCMCLLCFTMVILIF